MKPRLHAALLSVLALILGAGALVLTSAGSASALDGTVTITPGSGKVTDATPFGQISVSEPCPEHYQDGLNLFVTLPGDLGDTGVAFGLTDGAPFSGATISTNVPPAGDGPPYVTTIETAFSNANGVIADGSYPLKVVCLASDQGTYTDTPTFSTIIDISGDSWSVSQAAPATNTSITLASDPVGHVVVNKPLSLKAAVTPADAPGKVQFYLAGSTPAGDPVPVTGGTAETTVPGSSATGAQVFSAAFVPDDPLKFTSSTSTELTVPMVSEPSITVNDDTGDTLGETPSLKADQKVAVTLEGFLPATGTDAGGEKVTVALDGSADGLAKADTDAEGKVVEYAFTVPSAVADGSHTLTFTGDTSAIEQPFAFTVGDVGDGGTAGTTSGTTGGDDGGSDAGTTAGTDAGTTAGSDAGTTAGSDAGTDAGTTAGSDAGASGGSDAGSTAGTSAGTSDGSSSVGPDGGSNGTLAATGTGGAVPLSVLAFLLIAAGGYLVHRARRDGRLLDFGSRSRD